MASNMNISRKKPTSISIEEKLKIVKRLEAGELLTDLAAELNVHRSTLYRIIKEKENILHIKSTLEMSEGNINKKRHRGREETLLERKLYTWFKQKRAMGFPVTGPILQETALNFNQRLGGDNNFKASTGWLRMFKARHGIRFLVQDEKLSKNPNGLEFKEKFKNIILSTGVKADAIYNCDQTGLYWKFMPIRTVGKHKKRAEARNKPEERITVMACTNASGSHKLKLFVIGKTSNPKCFRDVKYLPIEYKSQQNALMDQQLMMVWFSEVFVPEVRKRHKINNNSRKKIVLIMDNASCHPPEAEIQKLYDFITVIFLPVNTTSSIQPLRQGIIEKFKKRYKSRLLSRILVEDTAEEGEKYLNSYNLLMCAHFCAFAWYDVSVDDVRNGWKNLIPFEETPAMDWPDVTYLHGLINHIPRFSSITLQDTESWLKVDDDEIGWQCLSDENILFDEEFEDEKHTIEQWDEDSRIGDPLFDDNLCMVNNYGKMNNITAIEALKGITCYIRWYEINNQNDDILTIKTLYDCQTVALDRMLEEKDIVKFFLQ